MVGRAEALDDGGAQRPRAGDDLSRIAALEADRAAHPGDGIDDQAKAKRRHGRALVAARMMLADEELVEAELVSEMDERDVALEGEGRVLPRRVSRHHEEGEFHITT